MRYLIIFICCLFGDLVAQDSLAKPALEVSGYIECYYTYDSDRPANHVRSPLFVNHNRHQEVSLNVAILKAQYNQKRSRGNLALMAGTYPQYNLASEPAPLRNIYEANIGFRLHKTRNLWADVGIMPSHIGFEGVIGMDNWNLTRSLLAENSPYYESGARVSYLNPSGKIYFAVMYLNGWQRIQKINGNSTPAFGTQLTFLKSEKITFNWSTYVGNEFPDSLAKWRYFNNLFCKFQLNSKIGIMLGFDYGMQQVSSHSGNFGTWTAPVMILRYKPTSNLQVAARVEYFDDDREIIVSGKQISGCSLNIDFLPVNNLAFRMEARLLSFNTVFLSGNSTSRSDNHFITAAICLKI